MAEFLMPSLGADMDYGTLVEWMVKPGDRVRRGDIIALVETDKGLIEIEVFDDGVIESLLAEPGTELAVGAVMAMIGQNGQAAAAETPAKAEPPAPREPIPREKAPPPPSPAPPAPARAPRIPPGVEPPGGGARPRVSPLARRRAAEFHVDLATVIAGEGNVIRVADVENTAAARGVPKPAAAREAALPAAPPPAAPPAPAERAAQKTVEERTAAMRRAIATAMTRAKREIPHYYLETHIDLGRALAWLAEENRKRPVTERLLHSLLLVKAVALAARAAPEMNGFWIDGEFRPSEHVHVGMAISLRKGGLVAPALHDADRKPLGELMKEILDVTNRARTGVLRSSEVADATITVTNLGDQGVESVFGVIHPPQVALVGFGKMVERPWASGGMLGVRPVISATLSADHRASDGHCGGRFLAAIDGLLQEPEKL
jgi:pyruvate dehydrogenase E2 component (dihydrolipoamide acetyltransferase)